MVLLETKTKPRRFWVGSHPFCSYPPLCLPEALRKWRVCCKPTPAMSKKLLLAPALAFHCFSSADPNTLRACSTGPWKKGSSCRFFSGPAGSSGLREGNSKVTHLWHVSAESELDVWWHALAIPRTFGCSCGPEACLLVSGSDFEWWGEPLPQVPLTSKGVVSVGFKGNVSTHFETSLNGGFPNRLFQKGYRDLFCEAKDPRTSVCLWCKPKLRARVPGVGLADQRYSAAGGQHLRAVGPETRRRVHPRPLGCSPSPRIPQAR